MVLGRWEAATEERSMSDQLPLTLAQQQTARELPWYREWLLANGRSGEEVDQD
jgi:hypothetical protein